MSSVNDASAFITAINATFRSLNSIADEQKALKNNYNDLRKEVRGHNAVLDSLSKIDISKATEEEQKAHALKLDEEKKKASDAHAKSITLGNRNNALEMKAAEEKRNLAQALLACNEATVKFTDSAEVYVVFPTKAEGVGAFVDEFIEYYGDQIVLAIEGGDFVKIEKPDEKKEKPSDSSSGKSSGEGKDRLDHTEPIILFDYSKSMTGVDLDYNEIKSAEEIDLPSDIFNYQTYDPEYGYKTVKENIGEDLAVAIAAFSIVVGRLTSKKISNVKLFKSNRKKDQELSTFLKQFAGGKKYKDLNLSQVASAACALYPAKVLNSKPVKGYVAGGASSETYADRNDFCTFDFAAWFPLNEKGIAKHLAYRFFRAATKSGYVEPDPHVTLLQVNFARLKQGIALIEIDVNRVNLEFDTLRLQFAPSLAMIAPMDMLRSIEQRDRNEDINLSSEMNTKQQARAKTLMTVVKKNMKPG
jgi:hypothetical protein